MRYGLFIFIVIAGLLGFSCQTAPKGQRTPGERTGANSKGTDLAWDNHFKDYFDKSCNTCHGKGGTKPYLYTYRRVENFAQGWLQSVEDGRMPKGSKASEQEKRDLREWVQAGLPEKAPEATSADDGKWDFDDNDEKESGLTYEGQIKDVIQKNCVSCHSPGGTFPDLSTYNLLRSSAERSRPWIDDGRMPQGSSMPVEDKEKFYQWIDSGMPESSSTIDTNDSGNGFGGSSNDGSSGNNSGNGTISYQANIQPYIASKCSPCHTSQSLAGVNIGSEQAAKSSASSWVNSVINNRMPQSSPASQSEKDMIQQWLNNGTP